MIVERLPDTLDQLLVEAGPARTPGLHLSQIIWSLCNAMEPGKYSGPINPLYTDPGFTFERVLETAWSARHEGNIFRPGEFEQDGILCSPDYVDLSVPDGELIESKMTEMSMKGCPTEPKFRKWLWQIGAYCHVLQLTRARLHVLWLRGDYGSIRRAYSVDRITWEPGETERIWQLLTNHAREHGWLVQTPDGLQWSGSLPLKG